jgi:hypothetical protein
MRPDRVDAKVAATLLEETVDVHRLGVGLDGDVLWAVRRCVRYDKCGNCPESETSVSIWMNIMGVAVYAGVLRLLPWRWFCTRRVRRAPASSSTSTASV